MKIEKIYYNWTPSSSDGKDDYLIAMVGQENVVEIKEHPAAGEGDKWYYDIIFKGGGCERVFNPNRVFFINK